MKGTANLFEQYFNEHEEPAGGWKEIDGVDWTAEQLKWFTDRGCEYVKPEMEPGDFVLWDSRKVHYGAAPEGDKKRFAIYICYKPDENLREKQRKAKVEVYERGYCMSHDPTDFVVKNDQEAEWNIHQPHGKPTLTEKTQRAIGLKAY